MALHNLKVAAVPVVLYGCVVAIKNPQVPLLHIATSFSSLSLLSYSLPGFYWDLGGKSCFKLSCKASYNMLENNDLFYNQT